MVAAMIFDNRLRPFCGKGMIVVCTMHDHLFSRNNISDIYIYLAIPDREYSTYPSPCA